MTELRELLGSCGAQVTGLIARADILGGGKEKKNVTFSFQVFQMELLTFHFFHFKMTFFSFNTGQNKARERELMEELKDINII